MDETDALPCPHCNNDFQTGPDWNDDGSVIWWDCECGLDGPEAKTDSEAIALWNQMVTAINESHSHLEAGR